ncbi:MAG: ATP-binding protein [Chthoniobacterales bacterium]
MVSELRKLPAETAWLEFKRSYAQPDQIGEYISALSNSAAVSNKDKAYVVWGISNENHSVVGTTFDPSREKKGSEALENWMLRLLNPRISFSFHQITYESKRVVVLEIARACGRPVQFQGVEFIRVGSYVQKLKDHPQIEKELWRIFDDIPFEELNAAQDLGSQEALSMLDYPTYFDLLGLPLPTDRAKIVDRLAGDRLLKHNDAGNLDITNLGAILFAKDLSEFSGLRRKPVRVIVYQGVDRLKTIRERVGKMGYAAGFERMIDFVTALLPRNEVIAKALRRDVPMYPDLAVRELVANAVIHQDLSATGSGPMVEIFTERMEITNPGLPLVQTDRFLDAAPRSRNEALAALMRRVGICEERGSGVDKVVHETEFYQLPAPSFEISEGSTRAVLFAHKAFRKMDKADRQRACYLHACLRFVQRDPMTNSSLRERFGIQPHNSAVASRIIADAIEDGLIKAYDPTQGKKFAKYVPFWA